MTERRRQRGNGFRRLSDAAGVAALVVVGAILSPVLSRAAGGFDRNRACIQNGYELARAVRAYAQDYDDMLPPMDRFVVFQTLVLPYVNPSRLSYPGATVRTAFRCPATGYQPYVPNASIGWHNLYAVGDDLGDVAAFGDAVFHDGGRMIAFLDGHVERGGKDQADPAVECPRRAGSLLMAMKMYAQDYDEVFPRFRSEEEMKRYVWPYVKRRRVFLCPETGLPFRINSALNGLHQAAILDEAPVKAVQDAVPHHDGARTTVYLDGYTERGSRSALPTAEVSRSRASQLAVAVLMYAQDYDGALPPLSDYTSFRWAILPYTRSSRTFLYPDGGAPFVPNFALNGHSYNDFPNRGSVVLLRAPKLDPDGLLAVAYLDGHVERVRP